MIRSIALLALAGLVLTASGAAAAPSDPAGAPPPVPKTFPYPIHRARLDNGLQVILVPMRSGGLVAYWSIVRTGARDEVEPGRTGFAHFFEHMMFRGTEKYPSDAYNAIVTRMGADANAFTSDDLTAYHLGIAAEDLEQVMEIESDRFEHLAYDQQGFKTEAGAVYGEYRKNRSSPFFTLYEAVHKAAFDKHTYGHTAMGYEPDIKNMPNLYDYSRSFFQRFYRPENVILLIVGDIQVEPTLAMVRKYYSGWQPGYVAPQVPAEPEQTAERRIDVPYEGRSLPLLWVAWKADAFAPASREVAATRLLAELAFGETSAIHKQLVLDEQVVEFLQASVDPNRDPGLFDLVTRIKDPSKVDYVLAEVDKTVAGYQANPPDAGRLADLKSREKYGFLMDLDTPDKVAGGLSRFIAITGGVDAVDTLFATIDAVTPADIQAAARKVLTNQRRTVAVLRGES